MGIIEHISRDGKDIDQFTIIGKGAAAKPLDLELGGEEYFLEKEKSKHAPVKSTLFYDPKCYLFKDRVMIVENDEGFLEKELLTRIKHWVLQKEKEFKKIERQVEAFEQVVETEVAKREKLSDSVKMFVWQRDEGKCAKCGKKEKLEFDHIIPVAEGGSNTERNIQILCESCNRSKGKMIV